MRRTQQWQKIVPHQTATIFNAVADVEKYSSFLPWCRSSRVLGRTAGDDASGDELQTEITVGYQTMSSTFRSRVRIDPLTTIHAESDANEYIEHLSFTWEFRPVGEQTCRLDLKLDFELRSPEHLLMWELGNEKIISEYVRQFSKRCRHLESTQQA